MTEWKSLEEVGKVFTESMTALQKIVLLLIEQEKKKIEAMKASMEINKDEEIKKWVVDTHNGPPQR